MTKFIFSDSYYAVAIVTRFNFSVVVMLGFCYADLIKAS